MLHPLLAQHLHYHRWRIARIAHQLRGLPDSALHDAVGGSFGTWHGLLAHLGYVNRLWLHRLRQAPDKPAAPEGHTFAELLDAWVAAANQVVAWFEAADAHTFDQPLAYRTTDGTLLHNTPAEMLIHLVDHDSFHSGQIAHALRDRGIIPAHTNWLYYYADRNAQ